MLRTIIDLPLAPAVRARYLCAMRFAQDDSEGRFQIQAYGPGKLTVNAEILTHSFIVSPERLIRDWAPQTFEDLTHEHLSVAAELRPEILILGTGARQRFPHPEVIGQLQSQGIGVEVMDTAAACRTYNVLVSERRRVAAALFMI